MVVVTILDDTGDPAHRRFRLSTTADVTNDVKHVRQVVGVDALRLALDGWAAALVVDTEHRKGSSA